MTGDHVIGVLREHMPRIREFGVSDIAIFGSCVRGEAGRDSDVDILVEFSEPVSIFQFLDLKDYLEGLLGRSVDLVMRRALKPQLREQIVGEAVSAD